MEHYRNLMGALGGAMPVCMTWVLAGTEDNYFNARDVFAFALSEGGDGEVLDEGQFYVVSGEGAIGLAAGYEYLTRWLFLPVTGDVRERELARLRSELEYDREHADEEGEVPVGLSPEQPQAGSQTEYSDQWVQPDEPSGEPDEWHQALRQDEIPETAHRQVQPQPVVVPVSYHQAPEPPVPQQSVQQSVPQQPVMPQQPAQQSLPQQPEYRQPAPVRQTAARQSVPGQEQARFCWKCGGKLSPNAKFCRNCGTSVQR